MLKAFDAQLKRLAVDTDDDFHFQIRGRIGKKATSLLERRLKNLVLIVPLLMSRILVCCENKEVPLEVKKLIGLMLTYLYYPRGFLPRDNKKLFDYLDDAYCMGLVYEKVFCFLKKTGVNLRAKDMGLLKQFAIAKINVKIVIPEKAEKISEAISGVLKGDGEFFYRVFS